MERQSAKKVVVSKAAVKKAGVRATKSSAKLEGRVVLTKRGEYLAKHGVTVIRASEALTDPDAVCSTPTTTRAPAKAFARLAFRRQRLQS